jgi:hypothetical protein
MMMSEKHDVTQSSNPDVQALLVVITGLAQLVESLRTQVFALAGEVASLPQQYVVPAPNGGLPPGTVLVGRGMASGILGLSAVGQNGAGYPGADPVDVLHAQAEEDQDATGNGEAEDDDRPL